MTDPSKLPEARLVPRTADDRISILRGHANAGARKAARVTVKVCRVVTVLAICGAGFAALRAGINTPPRSRALDDLDRQMESLRRIKFEMPKIETPKIDIELDRLRQMARDLRDPKLQSQLLELELTPEEIHSSR